MPASKDQSPTPGEVANHQQVLGAASAMAAFAAEELERIAALGRTLQVLMSSHCFYSSPSLAAAQLSVITELAEAACVSVDQMAESVGITRDRTKANEQGAALASFRRSRSS